MFAKGCNQISTLHCIESQISNFNMFYMSDHSKLLLNDNAIPSHSSLQVEEQHNGESGENTENDDDDDVHRNHNHSHNHSQHAHMNIDEYLDSENGYDNDGGGDSDSEYRSKRVNPYDYDHKRTRSGNDNSDNDGGKLKNLIISFVENFDSQPFIFERWNRQHLRYNNLMLEHLESLTVQKLIPTPKWFNVQNRKINHGGVDGHGTARFIRSPVHILYPGLWRNLTKLCCVSCDFTFVVENPILNTNNDVIYVHGLQYAPNLKELVLSQNRIHSILEDPLKSVGHFDTDGLSLNVQTLDLSYNQLSSTIGCFQYFDRIFINIRSLNLSSNKLTNISDICHLSMLESIDLSFNNLSDWSDIESLQQLSELNELWLEGNIGLQANSNYREYACGFFSHLTKVCH